MSIEYRAVWQPPVSILGIDPDQYGEWLPTADEAAKSKPRYDEGWHRLVGLQSRIVSRPMAEDHPSLVERITPTSNARALIASTDDLEWLEGMGMCDVCAARLPLTIREQGWPCSRWSCRGTMQPVCQLAREARP